VQNGRNEPTWDEPQWHGVKHIQDLSIVCGSVSIAFGMNETQTDKSKVARHRLVFGLLVALLGRQFSTTSRRSRPVINGSGADFAAT
jgi:hypothetical protein